MAKIWKEEGKERVVDEIRMIYDTTKSGLNDAVWNHWFTIPSVEPHLKSVNAGTCMSNCDVGKMFFNFMLELSLRLHAGVYFLYCSLSKSVKH